MKVYLVVSHGHDGTDVMGLFSTQEKAELFLSTVEGSIEEVEVDDPRLAVEEGDSWWFCCRIGGVVSCNRSTPDMFSLERSSHCTILAAKDEADAVEKAKRRLK